MWVVLSDGGDEHIGGGKFGGKSYKSNDLGEVSGAIELSWRVLRWQKHVARIVGTGFRWL